MKYTHSDLTKIAVKWLISVRGCGAVITEMAAATSEIPDAIGFRDGSSILIECKASRADFLADLQKPFRINAWQGMGDFRFYLCAEDIINPLDLPDKWGLLWIDMRGKTRKIVGPKGNIWNHQKEFRFDEKNIEAEHILLISALRRLQGR